MAKSSFFARLTGAQDDNYDEHYEDENAETERDTAPQRPHGGDLRVDVYQNGETIIIKAFTPGVSPNDVELSLTRDMLTVSAMREENAEAPDENYFTRELDWSPLERTILLPAEVDIDQAEATESLGVLTIRLPKIQKDRQRIVKVTRGNKSVSVN